ncbi:DUF3572 domain-containing protein [uncultured Cohaesibacter sp.]|uniref:DUF3572 domain-containing protein n=1 Tax=uncultured Cohaesibacter sp. TaxID=1002546 RepID=UPI0029316E04|nr:DUF3572 domain-containing protein [uncultured Cohaesibacter sp.]
MQKKQTGLNIEAAEDVAIKALGFLSQDGELLERFFALTGLDPSEIRTIATEPSFLAAVLDFMLSDDSIILTFAANNAMAPEDVMAAKVKLDPMSMASTGTL